MPHSKRFLSRVAVATWLLLAPAFALADTLDGAALVIRTNGTTSGTDATLTENGFAGTYLTLAAPGAVTIAVTASGTATGSVSPQLTVAIADSRTSWPVTAVAQTYTTQCTLPAGTFLLRIELSNGVQASGAALTIHGVAVAGATVSNAADAATLNANALAAADTYIANFRRGRTYVLVPGAAPGAPVHIELTRHAFRFGTEVPGTSTQASVDTVLADNPPPGSDAANYQQRLLQLFNGMTPGNAGKWDSNEPNQGQLTMEGIDRILNYAAQHGLRVRQHNLIWGSQQPNWVTELTTEAALPSPVGDPFKQQLLAAIQSRIGYYVHDRSPLYEQLDVYNESVHTGVNTPGASYWSIYGPSGIADIYNQVDAAAKQVGRNLVLCTNEYNVLCDGNDSFANWYREHIETLLGAGGHVTGVGIQYYSHESVGTGNSAHNASRVYVALNNLGVLGLPLELTEFGIKNDGTATPDVNSATDAQILDESMRLIFGTPEGNGFTIWGFWAGDVWNQAPDAVLFDQTWNITPAGQAYLQLMNSDWHTAIDTTADSNGGVVIDGFYGDYRLTAGGSSTTFAFVKGVLPDLTIRSSDIRLSSTKASGGDAVMIAATVHDVGAAAAASVVVRVTDNGVPIGADQVITGIVAGGAATAHVTWNTKGLFGAHTVGVIVDPDNQIPETDETNNRASVDVFVRGNKL